MTGNNKLRACALALAGLTAVSTAQAEETRGYVGLSAGQALVSDFCDGTEPLDCDDQALAIRAYAGATANEYISAEVGFTYVDDVEASGSSGAISGHVKNDLQAFDGTLMFGTSRENPVRVFAKAGIVVWRATSKGEVSAPGLYVRGDEEETGTSFRTGLGAEFDVTDAFAVRLDWDYLPKVGDDDTTGESDVHVLTIGPQLRF